MTPARYDAKGNTLSDAQGRSFTWDFENRLAQAVVPGTGTTTFRYDPFGRRIQKSGPLGTTNYLYDGENVAEELDNAGNVLARYTQSTGTDKPLATFRSGTTSYYQGDGLGSATSLSNLAASLANTYTYDSFGNLTASTGTVNNPFRYTARDFDTETGIYYYRARYYDSSTGRFVSEDPIQHRGGINFYSYVLNRPTVLRDPTGLCVVDPCNFCRQACDAQGATCHFAANIFYWECQLLCRMTPSKPRGSGVCKICRQFEDMEQQCDATTNHCKQFDCATSCQTTPPRMPPI